MVFKPAPRRREVAKPMEPIIDPAGWLPGEMEMTDDWIYELSEGEKGELLAVAEIAEKSGVDILNITQENFPLPLLDKRLSQLRDELLEGRGLFLIRGLPVLEMSYKAAAIVFWAMGVRFGRLISQNGKGHMIGHVKDFGGNYSEANVRGYQTADQMRFHSDQGDYVGLMCMNSAKSGGESLVASSVTIYNEMLKHRPDLTEILINEFYQTKHGEISKGVSPYYKLPIFSFQNGYFSARGTGAHALKAFDLPGVPAATDKQLEAFAYFQTLARECAFETPFVPGDIQMLLNHVMVHTRKSFQDWPEIERKRHLMRLWMVDDDGRSLIPGFRKNFCGIDIQGIPHSAPVNVFEAA
jgi:hypothetical protein